MSNVKAHRKPMMSPAALPVGVCRPDTPPNSDRATLTDRANALCVTLAQCEELLEAVLARVTGGPPAAGADMPDGHSLSGAVDVASMRADSLLANLRHLAAEVGA